MILTLALVLCGTEVLLCEETNNPPHPTIVSALEAQKRMKEFSQQRIEQAAEISLISPYFSLQNNKLTKLIVLNKFVDEVIIDIQANFLDGATTPAISFTLQARSHLEIDLREILAHPSDPEVGSLRLSFLGDEEMLQAWTVVSKSEAVMNFPLTLIPASSQQDWFSFWDTRHFPEKARPEPVYVVHNADHRPAILDVQWGNSTDTFGKEPLVLASGATHRLSPNLSDGSKLTGYLKLSQRGALRDVAVIGFLEGPSTLATLSVAGHPDLEASQIFHSFALPLDTDTMDKSTVHISLFDARTQGLGNTVEIHLIDLGTGETIEMYREALMPGEIDSLAFTLSAQHLLKSQTHVRLEVRAQIGSVVPAAYLLQDGVVVDVSLVNQDLVHSSGTYPLPDMAAQEAVTTLLNLGTEASEIVGQLHWDGGTYAIGPLFVPAGAGIQVDFHSLADQGEPDLLGNTIPSDLSGGFFHWRTRSGSHDLLARTEIRGHNSFDSFGFNCLECCPEMPWGDILPGPIGLNVGVWTQFSAVEMISTCNGQMGPFPIFPANLTYSSPVTWTGQSISSADYTRQRVAFSENREYMSFFCILKRILFGDDEEIVVDECLKENGPEGFDPRFEAGGCPGQTSSCDQCFGCCDQLKDVNNCRCDEIPGQSGCSPTLNAEACRTCKTLCLNKFGLTTCNSNAICLP